MKIGISGDWHIDHMGGTYLINGRPNREIDIDKQVQRIKNICFEKRVYAFMILGDLFHKSLVSGYYYSKMLDYLEMLSRNMKIIIMDGNHDTSESGSSIISPISRFKNKNIFVIEKAGFFSKIEGLTMFLAPHEKKENFKNYKSYTSYLLSSFGKRVNFMAGHFQPKDAIPGSEEDMFSGSTRFVDTSLFSKVPIFCAHVHKGQDLPNNTYIPGSIVRFNLGERKEEKRFLIYDVGNKVESIKLDCQKMFSVNIDLVNKNSYSLSKDKLEKYKDCLVGIKIKTTKQNRPKISRRNIEEAFDSVGAHIIQIKIKTEDKGKKSLKSSKKAMSVERVFSRILNKVISSKEDVIRIRKLGMDVLKEVEDA